jgi:probable rRNA maturation factor
LEPAGAGGPGGSTGLRIELRGRPPGNAPPAAEIDRLCALAAAAGGVTDGHIAIAFVDEPEIIELNARHRGRRAPTDVLSFPVDGCGPAIGPRELGDVVICAAQTADLSEAIVHGVLHLVGMDHECDDGEMLALQGELLSWAGADRARGAGR